MPSRILPEQSNPTSTRISGMDTIAILGVMNSADAEVASAVREELPRIAAAVDAITAKLEAGGRLIYIGAGTSGRLGVLDAVECGPTFNVPPDLVRGIIAGGERAVARAAEASEDDPAAGAHDLLESGFGAADVLLGIAASGRTPYVLGAVAKARELGAITCGISCTPDSELSRAVDYPIEPVPGPEVVT